MKQLELGDNREARKKRGAFYTPYPLARETVASTLAPLRLWKYPPERIIACDPACGDGVFLAAARDELATMLAPALGCSTEEALARAERQVIGIDIAPQAVVATRELLPTARIFERDALLGDDYWTANRAINVFVGNPPFLGGGKVTGVLGGDYFDQLAVAFHDAYRGRADLCTWFFRRAAQAIEAYGFGVLGFIATNTIAQGDTREAGLKYLCERGWTIYDAEPSFPWPGDAAVTVSRVCMGWFKHGIVEWHVEHRPGPGCGNDACLACRLSQGGPNAMG